ncbi:MAG: carbon-nitrogen hydrolase family protein [Myxococcales bacterium]
MALRLAILELPACWNDPSRMLAEAELLLTQAPADLALFPEASLTGYVSTEGDTDLRARAEPLDGPLSAALAAMAKRVGMVLAAPLIERHEDRFANAFVVMGPKGERLAHYRKRHPWVVERWATPGRLPYPSFWLGELRFTLAICYDLHFLGWEAAKLLGQADVLLFPSAWVEEPDLREERFVALARRFRVIVANANWGVGAPVVQGQGRSIVVSAEGEVLARMPPLGVGVGGRLDVVLDARLEPAE